MRSRGILFDLLLGRVAGSTMAAFWRVFLMPLDSLKTNLQVPMQTFGQGNDRCAIGAGTTQGEKPGKGVRQPAIHWYHPNPDEACGNA
eukprot:3104734-Amphidinium_carterae.1